jgi:sugar phosphate isomerase/epimerase
MNSITFSTLACPHWLVETIITKAAEYGYDGIEWRGGSHGHVQPGMSSDKKSFIREQCSNTGLTSIAVTAYTGFVSNSAEERQFNLDELKRYVDLAAEVGATYVRTFVGAIPEGEKLNSGMYINISDCLNSASEYAESAGVKIAIEPHDDFVCSSTVIPIFDLAKSRSTLYAIWDLGNTYAVGEDPDKAFHLLKHHIGYIHIKDGTRCSPGWQLCALGNGDVPLAQAFALLRTNGYQGALNVEWEYAWHPELDPPEIALPASLQKIREILATQTESS